MLNGDLNTIKMFFLPLLTQLPVLLVCMVGLLVTLSQWNRLGGGAIWAVLGFALALTASVLPSLAQPAISRYLLSGSTSDQRYFVMNLFSVFWAMMRGTSYGLLLVAIFVGRNQNSAAPSDPQAPGNRNPY